MKRLEQISLNYLGITWFTTQLNFFWFLQPINLHSLLVNALFLLPPLDSTVVLG